MYGFNKSKTMGVTSRAGTAYPCEAPEFSPLLSGVRVARSLVFCVMFVIVCTFVLFLLVFVLSILHRFTASDYLFVSFGLCIVYPS